MFSCRVYIVQFLTFTSLGSSLGGIYKLTNLFHTRNMMLLTLPWPFVNTAFLFLWPPQVKICISVLDLKKSSFETFDRYFLVVLFLAKPSVSFSKRDMLGNANKIHHGIFINLSFKLSYPMKKFPLCNQCFYW